MVDVASMSPTSGGDNRSATTGQATVQKQTTQGNRACDLVWRAQKIRGAQHGMCRTGERPVPSNGQP